MQNIVVIGGGAAGYFAAINTNGRVILLEKTRVPLQKVRISGGGRCNVTHSCFDPKLLVKNYPRGAKQLLGPFHRFQPRDTIAWFEERGVTLKTEEDGRMFPITDSSETIIQCLEKEAKKKRVDIQLETSCERIEKTATGFRLYLGNRTLECDRLLLASGSGRDGLKFAAELGHSIVAQVPSLFTFNIPDFSLVEFAGVSVSAATLKVGSLEQTGPLLITHWGFSGPAALKLSAWAARFLFDVKYETELTVNWLPEISRHELEKILFGLKETHPGNQLSALAPFNLPKSLWKHMAPAKRLSDISKKELLALADKLHRSTFQVKGKTTYKQEFVTAGGVALDEVNFQTMESKICPGLYFAGEILDIDGVTGGFNFQNAWTTGWIAAGAMSE